MDRRPAQPRHPVNLPPFPKAAQGPDRQAKGDGATVRNPRIYERDLAAERAASGSKEPRKVVVYPYPTEDQLRMLAAMAAQVRWNAPDGYLRFCHKLFKAPRPRNSREVTRLRLALQSIICQQRMNSLEGTS